MILTRLSEAMPIQEKASVKSAGKARPMLKPSPRRDVNFIPMGQRQWTEIEMQKSKDPHCFFTCQNSLLDHFDSDNKLIEKKMQEFISTKLLMDARKRYQTMQDVGQTKCCRKSSMLHIGHLEYRGQF